VDHVGGHIASSIGLQRALLDHVAEEVLEVAMVVE
jgi:hypothetical protein